MESWFRCWISFWMVNILFRNVSAEPPRYTIQHTAVIFDQAMEACSPGTLTTLATEHEVANILTLISKSVSLLNQNEFTFWVGLRKVKDECVVPTLPLRGFKWTEDGSDKSQVSRWTEEPKHTCTTVRCAALKGQLVGSTVTRWGLVPVSCKNTYQFICKLRDTWTGGTFKPQKPVTSERDPVTPEPKPATSEPKPATPEPHKSEPTPESQKPEPTASEPELPAREPEPDNKLKPKTGPELQGPDADPGSEPPLGSDLCQHPHIPSARSLILDPDNSSRILVECWSSVQLEVHCLGRPAVWRLLDDSPANFTTICDPCEDGFQKDTSGNCVDVDECGGGGAPCRHTCLNTAGSYRCVCSDENGKHHEEDSPVCTDTAVTGDSSSLSGILIPVLVAVAALVVLVVLVAVTVKCCLMRRSKRRAIKKAEKMAMRSKDDKDSFQSANAKVAI